ncbi:hypothetical protein BCR33DRAFT_694303 [Rhizoclosmatium globosum]|uniref:Thioesterase domain-containing protein n=1 Tax=Rhizoclosmatium globosum TaxID=329046 RepID=A0A1Y2CWP5_9FUNG|nr:hypothetical protein BCR33DRAFT_694303 [Rhizoclosmatium globosum]|eukprot:ORY51452.1 hypothetical protein BCR33DRAFT_694303 [Rhizoclosmatium globosum]
MTACEHDAEETYVPDDALVDEIQALPIAQRMFRNSKVYPFRPVQVSIDNCDAETSLFGNWAGILCDLTQEDVTHVAANLVQGPALYGANKIEYVFQGYDAGTGAVIKVVRFGSIVTGHAGIIHGGLIAAFFDDAFGSIFFQQMKARHTGVTANLSVNYRAPMPAGTNVVFVLWVEREEGRKVFLRAEARSVLDNEIDSDFEGIASEAIGQRWAGKRSVLYAEATALFIKVNKVEAK